MSLTFLFKSEIFGVGYEIFLGKVFIAETGQKRARRLVMSDRERKTAALCLGQQTVGFECFVNAQLTPSCSSVHICARAHVIFSV